MKIKTTVNAFLSVHLDRSRMKAEEIAKALYLTPGAPYSKTDYTQIGLAHVEVELFTEDQIAVKEVETLRAALQETKAEFSKRVMEIENEISKRLAITNCVEVTA
jgi:hypothetical protein